MEFWSRDNSVYVGVGYKTPPRSFTRHPLTSCWWLINVDGKHNSQICEFKIVQDRCWFCRTVAVFDNKLRCAVQLHWMWSLVPEENDAGLCPGYRTPEHLVPAICYQWISSVFLNKATSLSFPYLCWERWLDHHILIIKLHFSLSKSLGGAAWLALSFMIGLWLT